MRGKINQVAYPIQLSFSEGQNSGLKGREWSSDMPPGAVTADLPNKWMPHRGMGYNRAGQKEGRLALRLTPHLA